MDRVSEKQRILLPWPKEGLIITLSHFFCCEFFTADHVKGGAYTWMFTNWIMKISNLLTLCFLRMTQGKEYPRILFVFLLLYSLSNSNSTTFTMFTQAHFYNTSGYDLPPVVSSRDFTFPLQVLVVPPHSQLAQ